MDTTVARLSRLLVLWVLAVVATSGALGNNTTCEGGISFDQGASVTGRYFTKCPGRPVSAAEIVNHVRLPRAPWLITSVCVVLCDPLRAHNGSEVPFDITLYSADLPSGGSSYPYPYPMNSTGRRSPVSSVLPEVCNRSNYLSFNVSMVAWTEDVFLGIRANDLATCGGSPPTLFGNVESGERGVTVFSRSGQNSWQCWAFSCGSGTTLTLAIRLTGESYNGTGNESIPGWLCSREVYDDGANCDCECGIEDPDCVRISKNSKKCVAGRQICLAAHCQDHGWNTSKPGCDPGNIAVWNDGLCTCGCTGLTGVYLEPDCSRSVLPPIAPGSCPGLAVPKCLVGACVDRFLCDVSRYRDNVTCDCGCGIVDPDCEAGLPLSCGQNFSCRDDMCVPSSWTCPSAWYGNRSFCDCNCGSYDPDCDVPCALNQLSCPITATKNECAYNGSCVEIGCGNRHADVTLNETCDSGPHCNSLCQCEEGYVPRSPLRSDCASSCGNGIVTEGEECEGTETAFCNASSCLCLPGHPMILDGSLTGNCSGCGNGILEAGEECFHGAAHCNQSSCRCLPGYRPTDAGRCVLESSSEGTSGISSDYSTQRPDSGIVLTVLLAVFLVVVLALLGAGAVILVILRRSKISRAAAATDQQQSVVAGKSPFIPMYTLQTAEGREPQAINTTFLSTQVTMPSLVIVPPPADPPPDAGVPLYSLANDTQDP